MEDEFIGQANFAARLIGSTITSPTIGNIHDRRISHGCHSAASPDTYPQ
jgi:hypothetical protein